jgi:flavin reductase (DIM6/NTAB) family NADH-FMN oxidoreductase RutF/AcrR family transcriptional regulator
MTLISEHIEPDTRERILVVAERLFRQIGYQKTTVADIAKELRMSPANVYRFFDSKKAIHEGVARTLMGGVEIAAETIAARRGSAASRLRELMTTIHRMNCERYVGDSKLHEMVEIAMEESWEVCVAHMERITHTIAAVIAEGTASGEFEAPDVPLAAMCATTAMMRFFHPQMIAQCANKPGPSLDEMIDFVIAGLAPRTRCQGSTKPSFRGDAKHRTRNLEIPGLVLTHHPGMTVPRENTSVTEKDIHSYEPANGHGLRHDPFNAIIAPRPIGWISSRDAKGHINLAPYSFFNGFCYTPPIIGFSSTSWKDSVGNIQETKEFVWNLATKDLAQQMNATAAHVAHDVSEFKIAGLTAAPSKLVNVPRVAESPVSFECKLTQIIQLQGADGKKAQAWLTLGEVVAVHIDKAMIKDGVYQTALARPIVRAGRKGDYFEIRPDAMFEMTRPD